MKHQLLLVTFCVLSISGLASAQVCNIQEIDNVPAPGSLSSIVIVGSTAYVAAADAGVVELDITDPAALSVIGFDPTEGNANDLALEYFRDLLVVAEGSAGVGSYGITNDGLEHFATTALSGGAIAISGSSDQYYVGTDDGHLYSIQLDGDNVPQVVGSVELGGEVRGLVERSRRVYCALGTGNAIAVVDVEDPTQPTELGTIPVTGSVLSIARNGSDVLVGVAGLGLQVFSISEDTLIPGADLTMASAPESLFAWDDRIYMASPGAGVAIVDASLGSGLLQIAELELSGASALALSGDELFVSRGSAGFSSVDLSACSNSGGSQTTWFIPASARAEGSANSYWVTDVAITNFTNGIATFNLAYLVKDDDNSNPLNVTMALASGQQMMLRDVFDSVFGLAAGNGALRIITSDADVKTTSRTYNAAGAEGTYGQFIPALTADTAIEAGGTGTLQQLQENDGFRTNIGLVNLGSTEVQVRIRLFTSDGTAVGEINGAASHLEPFGMTQISQAFVKAGAGQVDDGYAIITVVDGSGQILAYASVVDNGSNDPVYMPHQSLLSSFAH